MIYSALTRMALLKFFVVGVINSLFGLGIMLFLYNVAGLSYWVSSAANYVITSIISYFVNGRITFKMEHTLGQASRFALNIIVCYLVAYGVARPLASWILSHTHVRLQDNIAMVIGMVLFSTLNYLGQRFFVFPKQKEGNESK